MMRLLPLTCVSLVCAFLLGACASLDTSPGASGVPDTPVGAPGFERGQITTGGQIILNRELFPR